MATEAKDLTTKTSMPKKTKATNLEYMRDKDREKVKGIFRFYEVPGGSMSFVIKAYKKDQVEKYDLVDGQTYEVPLGVAKHLNKNGWYPIHSHTVDEAGKPSMRVGKKVRRFGFQSLEFIDIDEFSTEAQNQILTVEKV